MTNKVQQDLFALEAELKNLKGTSELHATIYADSLDELKDAADYCKCHLYHPFEKNVWDEYYYFDYHLSNNRKVFITVRSVKQYRKRIEIEEI